MASKGAGFSSAVFRKKFRSGMTVRSYRDNEIIFSQGGNADAVFYIQSGTVQTCVRTGILVSQNAAILVCVSGVGKNIGL